MEIHPVVDRRGITLSYRTLLVAAGVLVALFAVWSKRDALAAWWNRPAAQTAAAPVVNVPAPQVTVEAPPELLWEDRKNEYDVSGVHGVNVKCYRCGFVSFNEAETGDWWGEWYPKMKRLRARAENSDARP